MPANSTRGLPAGLIQFDLNPHCLRPTLFGIARAPARNLVRTSPQIKTILPTTSAVGHGGARWRLSDDEAVAVSPLDVTRHGGVLGAPPRGVACTQVPSPSTRRLLLISKINQSINQSKHQPYRFPTVPPASPSVSLDVAYHLLKLSPPFPPPKLNYSYILLRPALRA